MRDLAMVRSLSRLSRKATNSTITHGWRSQNGIGVQGRYSPSKLSVAYATIGARSYTPQLLWRLALAKPVDQTTLTVATGNKALNMSSGQDVAW